MVSAGSRLAEHMPIKQFGGKGVPSLMTMVKEDLTFGCSSAAISSVLRDASLFWLVLCWGLLPALTFCPRRPPRQQTGMVYSTSATCYTSPGNLE